MTRALIAMTYLASAYGVYTLVEVVRRSNMTFEPKIAVMLLIAGCAGYMLGKAGRALLS